MRRSIDADLVVLLLHQEEESSCDLKEEKVTPAKAVAESQRLKPLLLTLGVFAQAILAHSYWVTKGGTVL